MSLTNLAIRHYVAVLVLCVGLMGIGAYSYVSLPRENFPDVEIPYVFVTTVLDGANPTDVEESVTIPMESALDGVEGVKEMRSSSADSTSLISLEFLPKIEMQAALQRVRDAVDIGKSELPPDADEPTVREFDINSEVPVLIYQLIGRGRISTSELKELAEKLEDELEQISGVQDVEIVGGRDREVHIEVDPERLHFYDLTLARVQAVMNGSNRNVSAGTSETLTSRIVMRVPGQFRHPGDVLELVLGTTRQGKAIYVRDVATVRYGFEDETSRARTYDFAADDGKHSIDRYVAPSRSVGLHLSKRAGENILRIVNEANKIVNNYPLPSEITVVKALDQSKDVNMMIADLENGIFTSLILVLIVILVGLGWRNAILVALAVPFSMLMSIIVIKAVGLTLNMIVLFSLILALGMLIDNAIVIVENIYRRQALGSSRVRAAMEGTAEVAGAVIASTATTVGAFLPLLFWPGLMGKFMGYLPRTVIIVLLCSLFVALVINPTLAALTMKLKKGAATAADPETERPTYAVARYYRHLLEFLLRRPRWTVCTSVALFLLVFAAYGVFGVGVEFFPDVDPDTVTCSISPPDGVSLEESDRLAKLVEDRIFAAPGSVYKKPVANLKHAGARIGLEGVNGGSVMTAANLGPVRIEIEFVDREFRTEPSTATIAELRRRIEGLAPDGRRLTFPLCGAEFDVVRPQEGPPTGAPVSIDIFGEDLNQMTKVVREMKRVIANTKGAAKPTDNASTAQPTLEWNVDLPRAGLVGLDQGTVGGILQMSVGGLNSGTVGHGDDEKDIVIRLPEEYRVDTNRLKNVTVPTAAGGAVPIVSVATADLVPGPITILHYNRKRILNAAAEVQPGIRADATIRKAFQEQAAQYPFPPGITYHFGGAAEEEEAAKIFLTQAFVVAVFIITVVLVIQFNSVVVSGIVLTSVMLSMMGVFTGLLVLQTPFGIIMTGIGVISLAGVVVNNAILLLDAIQRLESSGRTTYEAVVTASMIRFRPVLLTAITTILALIPMALKVNFDFKARVIQYDTVTSQFWQSMAMAVIFGLLISTVLTLGVVPTLYLLYARAGVFLRQHLGFGAAAEEIRDETAVAAK